LRWCPRSLINRYLGPEKNGYIVYVSYIASLVSGLGGFGIPATTRKYMAEFIGMGDRGTARYIFFMRGKVSPRCCWR
jgi:O-antigen/teichoic acid export membrane protein